MQTNFSLAQLADPDYQASNDVLRKCVHCGFCTATCPTFVLLGDELDSPRGRIYLMREMLQQGGTPSEKTVTHIDRCLSCLSCMTTCPSGVHYMHLVDHGRKYIEENYTRPWPERALRELLARVLPYPWVFRLSLLGARVGRPFARLMPGRLKTLVAMAPRDIPSPSPVDKPQVFAAEGARKKRVLLMSGCAQQVLRPAINEATVRVLNRLGCEVVVAEGQGCCGALVHHMGRAEESHAAAIRNIEAWENAEMAHGEVDAVIINASGCGTTVKDYGFMLRDDETWASRAERISRMTRDVSEFIAGLDVGAAVLAEFERPKVTYHSACSMQHGQKLKTEPVELLKRAGFEVSQPAESHICCGSAGTYNLTQPALADRLKVRKSEHIARTPGEVVATGNIGCLVQIENGLAERGTPKPVVHTVELVDWATGGPKPAGLE